MNFNIKKIFILVFLIFLLSSCFWKSSEEKQELEKNEKVSELEKSEIIKKKVLDIKWNWFFVKIPSKWIKVPEKQIPEPRVGKVVLAVQDPEMKNGFMSNFLIIKQKLKIDDNSTYFSISNHVRAYKKYTNYDRIDYKKFIFNSWDKSLLYIFKARYNSKTTKQKFLQVWKICNKNEAYILTIGINIGKTNYWDYEYLLKSFRCEGEKEEEKVEEKK